MKKILFIGLILILIIIIGLFIELSYNKKKSLLIVVLPSTFMIIKGKKLNQKDDLYIYNSDKISYEEMFEKIPKNKRNRYHEIKLSEHIAKKFSKPFDESYNDIKESFCDVLPVSFVYKTVTNIIDLTHNLITNNDKDSPYRLLVSDENERIGFIDGNNVYIR